LKEILCLQLQYQDNTKKEQSINLNKPNQDLDSKIFEVYEDMPYHIDFVQLPESLKLIGVAKTHDWSFSNIEDNYKNYINLVKDKSLPPYIEIGVTSNVRKADTTEYIYGCLVDSIDKVPDGMF
jgi:hypothetical protein